MQIHQDGQSSSSAVRGEPDSGLCPARRRDPAQSVQQGPLGSVSGVQLDGDELKRDPNVFQAADLQANGLAFGILDRFVNETQDWCRDFRPSCALDSPWPQGETDTKGLLERLEVQHGSVPPLQTQCPPQFPATEDPFFGQRGEVAPNLVQEFIPEASRRTQRRRDVGL